MIENCGSDRIHKFHKKFSAYMHYKIMESVDPVEQSKGWKLSNRFTNELFVFFKTQNMMKSKGKILNSEVYTSHMNYTLSNNYNYQILMNMLHSLKSRTSRIWKFLSFWLVWF